MLKDIVLLQSAVLVKSIIKSPLLLALVSVPYALWEAYWIYRAGYPAIKWHTHLMLYYYIWLIGYFLMFYFLRKRSRTGFMKIMIAYTATLVVLLGAEATLLILRVNQTGIESTGQGYQSCFASSQETWYHVWPSDQTHWLKKPEYSYIRHTNSMGYSDMEWPLAKPNGQRRILSLGDSFTEGDGAPYDSSYVSQLRKLLNKESDNCYVMNAGICGSDPFISFVNYRDRLQKYQPDLILQTISSGDMNVDILIRGGLERFKPDGSVQFRKGPWWEPVYAVSSISRLAFSAMRYDQVLMKEGEVSQRKRYLDSITIDLFNQYAALAKRNHARLIVVLQPFHDELNNMRYNYDFTSIEMALKQNHNIEIRDLMPFFAEYIKAQNKEPGYYYWPHDGHHNPPGYLMMAEGMKEFVSDRVH